MRIPPDTPRTQAPQTAETAPAAKPAAPPEPAAEGSSPEAAPPRMSGEEARSRQQARSGEAQAIFRQRVENQGGIEAGPLLADAGGPQTDVGPVPLGNLQGQRLTGQARVRQMAENYLNKMPPQIRDEVRVSLSKLGVDTHDMADALTYVANLKDKDLGKMAGVGALREERYQRYTELSSRVKSALKTGDQKALDGIFNETGGLGGFYLQAQELARREDVVRHYEADHVGEDPGHSDLHQKMLDNKQLMDKQIAAYGQEKSGQMLLASMNPLALGPAAYMLFSKDSKKVNPVDNTNTRNQPDDPGPDGKSGAKEPAKGPGVETPQTAVAEEAGSAGRPRPSADPKALDLYHQQSQMHWEMRAKQAGVKPGAKPQLPPGADKVMAEFAEKGTVSKELVEKTIAEAGVTSAEVLEQGLKHSSGMGKISKLKVLGEIDDAATLVVLMTGLMYAVYDKGSAGEPFNRGNVY
ncbi:MAG: hypothetical protein GC160_06100 [Acidobacteria bacterium]|nr:hypothetical protein [Acidobacteriota bacterium]